MSKLKDNQLINPLDEEKETLLIDSKKMEKLAYWFFRLNGFLNIENFVVHPNEGSNPHTDIDLLAVRFPYRKELPESPNPMQDYELFIRERERIQIYLVEVKARKCKLNETWTKRDNMRQILSAVGPFELKEVVNVVSNKLCEQGWYKNHDFYVSLLCFGSEANPDLSIPTVPQIILDDALDFIYERFRTYQQKVSHGQWDIFGRNLWHCTVKSSNVDDFRIKVKSKLLRQSSICNFHAKCPLCLWL